MNRANEEHIIAGVIVVVLLIFFISIFSWAHIETANNFTQKCSKSGGLSTFNGEHWVCIGANQ